MMEYQRTQEAWDAFVQQHSGDGGLLQSWDWGTLQEKEGHKIWRLHEPAESQGHSGGPATMPSALGGDGGGIAAVCLLVEHRLPLGLKYIYAPRGPVITKERMNIWTEEHTLDNLIRFVKEQDAVFLRIEPPYTNSQYPISNSQFRSVAAVQPKQTLRIDLTQFGDELLKSMHQKTRYNIGLAKKRGVRVAERNDIETFWKLLQTTTKRDGFHMHPRIHYEKILSTLDAKLFFAEHNGQLLATALVAFFGTTAYYLHGASANEHRDVMAPYLLHWSIMREAKRLGCTVYDLWGINEKRWPGVTRFKKGFAPHTPFITYPGTFDIPIRKGLYWLYQMAHRL